MVWLAPLGGRSRQVQRLDDEFGTLRSAVMASPAHRGQRVLVVDDDVEFGTAASLLLAASGYEVVGQPGTAADGLSAALALRPDVVLLDISLPDGNGFDVAKRLTELENPAALIMISSRDSCGLSAAALRERSPEGSCRRASSRSRASARCSTAPLQRAGLGPMADRGPKRGRQPTLPPHVVWPATPRGYGQSAYQISAHPGKISSTRGGRSRSQGRDQNRSEADLNIVAAPIL